MKLATTAISILATSALYATTSLSIGDLTVIRFNGKKSNVYRGMQDFSFVTWKSLEAGTTINFTDKGVKSNGDFSDKNFDKGVFTWEATQSIAAGTVIKIEFGPYENTYNSSIGSLTTNGHMLNFSTAGDQIFLFQGNLEAPTFIFGLNSGTIVENEYSEQGWFLYSTTEKSSALPVELNNNETTFGNFSFFSFWDNTNGQYTGPRTGLNEEEYKQAIANHSNWTFAKQAKLDDYNPTAFELPHLQPSVPEPAHTGIALGILTLIFGAWKKRRAS